MKVISLLTVVAMLSILLCGALGTVYAVLGVADDVPGQDIVIPFICGRIDLDHTNTLNTLYTFAELLGTGSTGAAVVSADRVLFNDASGSILDFPISFTSHDLLSFDCISDFYTPPQSTSTLAFYTASVTTNGVAKSYLAGYIVLVQASAENGVCTLFNIGAACTSSLDCIDPAGSGSIGICDKALPNRFLGWNYLVDLSKGFASGFDSVSEEGGAGPNLGEALGAAPVTAERFYPRLYVHNALTQTYNWWIILAGRNELDCSGVTPAPGRFLTGEICSPGEVCPSFSVGIPFELNIIDVMPTVPQVASIPGFPKSALAIVEVVETVSFATGVLSWNGTVNFGPFCGVNSPAYSMWGWSYERAQSDRNAPSLSWDVIHPFDRDYCFGDGVGFPYVTGILCPGPI